jgi:hypothetical protein
MPILDGTAPTTLPTPPTVPTPGGDAGAWGGMLNVAMQNLQHQILFVRSNPIIGAGSMALASISTVGASSGQVLVFNGASLVWGSPSGPDLSGYATVSYINGLGLAPLNSPIFTGTPTAPTPTESSPNNAIATKEYTSAAIGAFEITLQNYVFPDFIRNDDSAVIASGSSAANSFNSIVLASSNSDTGGVQSAIIAATNSKTEGGQSAAIAAVDSKVAAGLAMGIGAYGYQANALTQGVDFPQRVSSVPGKAQILRFPLFASNISGSPLEITIPFSIFHPVSSRMIRADVVLREVLGTTSAGIMFLAVLHDGILTYSSAQPLGGPIDWVGTVHIVGYNVVLRVSPTTDALVAVASVEIAELSV